MSATEAIFGKRFRLKGVDLRTIASCFVCVGAGCFGPSGRGASPPPLESDDLIAVWHFDDEGPGSTSLDSSDGLPMVLEGDASLGPPGSGFSGQTGDRALDLGTTGSTHQRNRGIVDSGTPGGPGFLKSVNAAVARDEWSVALWQRWHPGGVRNSSTLWFRSPSAGHGDRGWQAHLPWGNETLYFDTSGCCGSPETRLSGPIKARDSDFDWTQWHHFALIKNGSAKQIWIDGERFLSQSSGAAPLLADWTALVVGQSPTEPQYAFHGRVDDLALFGVALDADQIRSLARGQSPLSLAKPLESRPPNIMPIQPQPGGRSLDLETPVEFRVTTQPPNELARDRLRVWVNGSDQTANAVITGPSQAFTVRMSYPWESNQRYTVTVEAADESRRAESVAWSFDTIEHQNIALNARAYMMRFDDALPPTSNGNDGKVNTHAESTPRAVGSYWETDLEGMYAISEVRVIVPRAFRSRMAHATVRLYDAEHESVYSEHLRGS